MSYTNGQNIEAHVVQRATRLPLFRSALQSVTSAYTDIKGRYPLLGLVGGVAEIGVRSMSQAAVRHATPLLQSLEPQIEVANDYACIGLDHLENNFPVLHQSTEEVMGHLKHAFFLTLEDVQERVNDELDGVLKRWDRLTNAAWEVVLALEDTDLGRAATSGIDEVLTLSESALAYYMPLPPTLRREWEMRIQEYEDEDEDDEPVMWPRFRGLLLSVSLQLSHRALKLRDRLDQAVRTLGDTADTVGLSRLLEVVGFLLQRLQLLYMAQVYRLEALRELALAQVRTQARVLAELGPVRQVLGLPSQVRLVVSDLQDLGGILVQLLVNSTPLYNMLEQPSEQDVEDFLNQEDFKSDSSTSRDSANSLFLKAMDGRPRRRKSLYARSSRRGSASSSSGGNPQALGQALASLANDRRSSLKQEPPLEPDTLPSTSALRRRSSVSEVLLGPIMQFVSQSQKAYEFLSSEPVIPVVEISER